MRWARSPTAVVWQPSPARHLPRNGASASPTSTSAPTATSYACSPRLLLRASSTSTSAPPIRLQEPRKDSHRPSREPAAPLYSNHDAGQSTAPRGGSERSRALLLGL